MARDARRDVALGAAVAGWIPLGLGLDADAGIWAQRAIGAATWLMLLALLRGERRAERVQIIVAILIATVGEFTLSPLLGLYTYRLGNVPTFVPPGHGLIYLGALALGRSAPSAMRRSVPRLVVLAGGAWACWGAVLSPRNDWFGALLFVVAATFLLRGRVPLLYAAAWLLTSYLELVGTSLGNWNWAPRVPGLLIAAGNPPSGVCALYCLLDALALAGGSAIHRIRLAQPRAVTPGLA